MLPHGTDIPSGHFPSVGCDVYPRRRMGEAACYACSDCFPIDSERLALFTGGASTKTEPAAGMLAKVRSGIRESGAQFASICGTLKTLNEGMMREQVRAFVPCMFAVLNVATRELSVGSAGSEPMVVFSHKTRKVQRVNPRGVAVGFSAGPVFERSFEEQSFTLDPGDRIVMYTSEVFEASNSERAGSGDEMLDTFVRENAERSSAEFLGMLAAQMATHGATTQDNLDSAMVTLRLR